MNDPCTRRNRWQQNAEIARETHRHRRDRPRLNHQEKSPAVKESPERRVSFAQINVLATRTRKQSGQLAIRKRGGNRQQSGENPGKQQAAGGPRLPRNIRRHNKDAGSDHRAHDNHRAIEQSNGPHKARFVLRVTLWYGVRRVGHSEVPQTAAASFAASRSSTYCRARNPGSGARRISLMTATESAPA